MNKQITLSDCQELYNKFIEYTETAEQHEFPILAQIQIYSRYRGILLLTRGAGIYKTRRKIQCQKLDLCYRKSE